MSKSSAAFWIVCGAPIAAVDAWLSLQAMFGILNPQNSLSYAVAILVGCTFTAFAILSETFGWRRSVGGWIFWLTMFALDMFTSIVCAIWYGQLHRSYHERIDFARITIAPMNWFATSIYIFFVLVAAGGCIQLGRAFDAILISQDRA